MCHYNDLYPKKIHLFLPDILSIKDILLHQKVYYIGSPFLNFLGYRPIIYSFHVYPSYGVLPRRAC